jgi:hypothetical protein
MPRNMPSLKPKELIKLLEEAARFIEREKATIDSIFVKLKDKGELFP